MGISASQARLLSLTAKLSDIEFTAQQTTNAKIRLSQSTKELSDMYNNALNAKKLVYLTSYNNSTPVYSNLTAKLLLTYNPNSVDAQTILKNKNGALYVPSDVAAAFASSNGLLGGFLTQMGATTDDGKNQYYKNMFTQMLANGYEALDNAKLTDSQWIYEALQNGDVSLFKYTSERASGTPGFDSVSWSETSTIQEVEDETKIEQIKADYESKLSAVQAEDKKFDLSLKQLDTEHTAIQTEYDSVKKVIDKNIEGSFKTFG